MSTSGGDGPNAAQVQYWSGPGGERWVRHKAPHDAMMAPLTERVLGAMAFALGERVLDIGCGSGATTFEIARRVGPAGSVTGIDFSTPLLALAREQAAATPDLPTAFEAADAETHAFAPASFDVAFSRFGVMFFRNPATAFANVRGATVAGGRLGFVCWRAVRENSWAGVTIDIARRHLELPPPPGPEDPGPYSFRDSERVRRILTEAGWSAISIEPLDAEAPMGADLEAGVANCLTMGPIANQVVAAPKAVRTAIAADLRKALPDYVTEAGVVMHAACWLVRAAA